MSHPVPGRSYEEDEEAFKPRNGAIHKLISMTEDKRKNKDWFTKHGLDKKTKGAMHRALAKKKSSRKEQERGEAQADFERGN